MRYAGLVKKKKTPKRVFTEHNLGFSWIVQHQCSSEWQDWFSTCTQIPVFSQASGNGNVGLSVCYFIHHFCPCWNISTTVGRVEIHHAILSCGFEWNTHIFCTGVYVSHSMNCDNFADPLMFLSSGIIRSTFQFAQHCPIRFCLNKFLQDYQPQLSRPS